MQFSMAPALDASHWSVRSQLTNQFPHLSNGDNVSSCLIGELRGLNERMCETVIIQHLGLAKNAQNVNCHVLLMIKMIQSAKWRVEAYFNL